MAKRKAKRATRIRANESGQERGSPLRRAIDCIGSAMERSHRANGMPVTMDATLALFVMTAKDCGVPVEELIQMVQGFYAVSAAEPDVEETALTSGLASTGFAPDGILRTLARAAEAGEGPEK